MLPTTELHDLLHEDAEETHREMRAALGREITDLEMRGLELMRAARRRRLAGGAGERPAAGPPRPEAAG